MVAACGWAHKDGICNCHQPWRLAPDDVRVGQPVASQDRPGIDVDSIRAALTDEDEIAHGESWDDVRKKGLGVCAYCEDEWPCRTQRGIDRLLAALSEHPDTGDAPQS